MQVKSCKYMLQIRENYNNIQEPTNKMSQLGRHFTIYIARQNMLFIMLGVQYATCSMSVKIKKHSTLDRTITGKM